MLGRAGLPLRGGFASPAARRWAWGGVCGDGAVPLLGGADIPGVAVSGCEGCSLKTPERCGISLGIQGNPLVGALGLFLLLIPDHWPRGEVTAIPPILWKGETNILLLIRFLGSAWVSDFAEDEAGRQSSRNKPAYLNIYLPSIT